MEYELKGIYVKYTNTEKVHNPKTHVEMECSQLVRLWFRNFTFTWVSTLVNSTIEYEK